MQQSRELVEDTNGDAFSYTLYTMFYKHVIGCTVFSQTTENQTVLYCYFIIRAYHCNTNSVFICNISCILCLYEQTDFTKSLADNDKHNYLRLREIIEHRLNM